MAFNFPHEVEITQKAGSVKIVRYCICDGIDDSQPVIKRDQDEFEKNGSILNVRV